MEFRPVLSLVTTGRNDDYQGNFLWRLETTLNYIGRRIASIGRCEDIEFVVVDWGSGVPLHSVLKLEEEARRIARFILVPPEVAARENKDGKFAGSVAINTGVRRSRGTFIAQTGGDILFDEDLLKRLLDLHGKKRHGKNPIDKTLFHIPLKNIPEEVVGRNPDLGSLENYIAENKHGLRKKRVGPFLKGGAAALLMHRDLWFESHGLDESWFGWGWTDADLNLRICLRDQSADYGGKEGLYAYHMDHPGTTIPIDGKFNPFVVNDRYWGMAEHRFAEFPPDEPFTVPVLPDPPVLPGDRFFRRRYFAGLMKFFLTIRDRESLRWGNYALNIWILDLPKRSLVRKAYLRLKTLKTRRDTRRGT